MPAKNEKEKKPVAAPAETPYDRYACTLPDHLGTKRKHCPLCGALFCHQCEPNHREECRKQFDVGH